jgi:hypothetical protein
MANCRNNLQGFAVFVNVRIVNTHAFRTIGGSI